MTMNSADRRRVWLAAMATLAAIAGVLATLWATETIGGDRNECRNGAVCGRDNQTNFGDGSNDSTGGSGR
ncbi:hypothetical protein OG444_33640 [Streptomyces sp. NBC_01232]|uniref:hypothetical protein n=1 Tax=unclassified Streptomyces TaxID=2593676 RepID=UPI002E12DCC2|nr:hypothetical protein OG444_33640 [Streptomyces sp. NBC_01232]